jgi:hypothetical protein
MLRLNFLLNFFLLLDFIRILNVTSLCMILFFAPAVLGMVSLFGMRHASARPYVHPNWRSCTCTLGNYVVVNAEIMPGGTAHALLEADLSAKDIDISSWSWSD